MNGAAGPPGWHGKLPSLGDFASRRLDTGFIEAWDGWLAAGLLALRQAEPEGWLETYLGSPSWRFLLMPGVMPGVMSGVMSGVKPDVVTGRGGAGQGAWAGVLMPSVDRVGRYFPLTLVQPLGSGPASTQQMAGLWHWLGRLDELARDALHEDWTVDRLEQELARMALPDIDVLAPAPEPPLPAAEGTLIECAAGAAALDAAQHIGAEAQRSWAAQARGRAWWYAQPDDAAPRLLLSRGLPAAPLLARLFGSTATI